MKFLSRNNVSFAHFLKYFAEEHAEWLMGKVIIVVSNNTVHQRIQMLLGTLLNLFLSANDLGQVLSAGVPHVPRRRQTSAGT